MKNWSVDEKKLKKYPDKYKIWRLEQLINFGLDGEKLKKNDLKKYWPQIKDNLDPHKKLLLEFLLWDKKPSSRQFKKDFWKP